VNAAKKCGINTSTVYRQKMKDPVFSAGWDEALKVALIKAEDELYRRAVKGWEEPVFYKGEETGHVQKFSDTCLIFFLKANNPEKYNPINKVSMDVSSADGSMIPRVVQVADESVLTEMRDMYKYLQPGASHKDIKPKKPELN
jgi:hypothetical protein